MGHRSSGHSLSYTYGLSEHASFSCVDATVLDDCFFTSSTLDSRKSQRDTQELSPASSRTMGLNNVQFVKGTNFPALRDKHQAISHFSCTLATNARLYQQIVGWSVPLFVTVHGPYISYSTTYTT